MPEQNISTGTKQKVAMAAQAAGVADVNGAAIDRANFESVTFIAHFGAIVGGGVQSIKAQGADSASGPWADLKDTQVDVADTDDGKLAILEVYRPVKQFTRMVLQRSAQNSTLNGAIALLGEPAKPPVVQDPADVAASEVHASPEEGTA